MSGALQFKSTAIFFNQLRGLSKILNFVIFGILHAVRRHREPRSGLLRKNNEELFSNCPAPYPRGLDRFKQFPNRRTGLVPGVSGRGGYR